MVLGNSIEMTLAESWDNLTLSDSATLTTAPFLASTEHPLGAQLGSSSMFDSSLFAAAANYEDLQHPCAGVRCDWGLAPAFVTPAPAPVLGVGGGLSLNDNVDVNLNTTTTTTNNTSALTFGQTVLLPSNAELAEFADELDDFIDDGSFDMEDSSPPQEPSNSDSGTFNSLHPEVKQLLMEEADFGEAIEEEGFALPAMNQQQGTDRFNLNVEITYVETLSNPSTGEVVYACQHDGCGQAFDDASNARAHMRKHSGERPFKCNFPGCDKVYGYSNLLADHKRSHQGNKPYVCGEPNCKAAFAQASNLRRHKRIHTNEKPYACDQCFTTFSQSSNLNAHLRRVHKIERTTEERAAVREQLRQLVAKDKNYLTRNAEAYKLAHGIRE